MMARFLCRASWSTGSLAQSFSVAPAVHLSEGVLCDVDVTSIVFCLRVSAENTHTRTRTYNSQLLALKFPGKNKWE